MECHGSELTSNHFSVPTCSLARVFTFAFSHYNDFPRPYLGILMLSHNAEVASHRHLRLPKENGARSEEEHLTVARTGLGKRRKVFYEQNSKEE